MKHKGNLIERMLVFIQCSIFLYIYAVPYVFAFEHPGGIHTKSEIASARKKIADGKEPYKKAYERLMREAKKGLERRPEPVADFNVPGYYSDAEGHRKAMGRLSKDAWAAYACAAAFQLTQGKERDRYADKTVQILDAWASTNKKTSNGDGNLAMADAGAGLVFAGEVLSDYKGWSKEKRERFKIWVKSVYLKACSTIAGRANNWGDWGSVGCIASHYFLDDEKGVKSDIEKIRTKIDHAISKDGSMPHETGRGKNGIWYTYFALGPMTAACRIGMNATGIDLFQYKGKDGAGIKEALDYLFKYSLAPDTWPHFKGKVNPPRARNWPGNLFEAMLRIYDENKWEDWIKESRPIFVYGHHYAWTMPTLIPPEGYLVSRKVMEMFEKGEQAEKEGSIGEAIGLYKQGLAAAEKSRADIAQCSAVRKKVTQLIANGEQDLDEARSLRKKSMFDKALALLDKLTSRYKGHEIAEKAESEIKQIEKNKSDMREAAKILTQAQDEIKNREYLNGVKLLRRILVEYGSTESADNARTELEALKKNPDAVKALKEAVREAQCRQYLKMAENFIKSGMPEEAVTYLDKIIKQYPDTKWAEQARKLKEKMR